MKHAKKPGKKKKFIFSKKNIAIASGVVGAVAILVLGVLNFQFIYGLIGPLGNRTPSGPAIEETEEVPEDPGDLEEEIEEENDEKGEPEEKPAIEEEIEEDEENEEEEEENLEKLPTIKLEIYEGPTYSRAGDVCYYRVKATVTGEPLPVISFSKDDSEGWLGTGKAQVNIARGTQNYTLIAVAENSHSKASETITLAWNCNVSPEIRSITLPGTLYTGRQYEVYADAVDLDDDTMSYSWSVTGGSIVDNRLNPIRWNTPGTPGDYNISVVVSDDKGNQSEVKTIKATVRASVSPITNSTSVVGYTDVTAEQLVSLFTSRNSTRADRARRLAPIYIKYGKMFNIRADIAWAQMCHETGFLEYTGDVRSDQNNFAGIGATGGGVPGNSFATEELGIIGHYAHLAWYYFPDHVNEYCSIQYDPRHFENRHKEYTGNTTLGFLNGRWAPGATYTDKIALFANEIFGF